MTQLVHLLSSSSFTINNFCLLTVLCSSRGRIPFITILRWFILFLRANAIQRRSSAIFSESSVSWLFVPQLITTYSSDCGRGMFSALHNTFWTLSPPIPQFIVFSSKNLYHMLRYLRKPATMESPSKISDTSFWRFHECCLVFMIPDPIFLAETTSRVGNPKTEVILSW